MRQTHHRLDFISHYGNPKLMDDAVEQRLESPDFDKHLFKQQANRIARSKNFTQKQHDLILSKDAAHREFVYHSPFTPAEEFDKELANPDGDFVIKTMGLTNQRASPNGYHAAMQDPDYRIRAVATLHHNDGSLLDAAVKDPSPEVRHVVTFHPKRTKEHLQTLSNDVNTRVREAAQSELDFWK